MTLDDLLAEIHREMTGLPEAPQSLYAVGVRALALADKIGRSPDADWSRQVAVAIYLTWEMMREEIPIIPFRIGGDPTDAAPPLPCAGCGQPIAEGEHGDLRAIYDEDGIYCGVTCLQARAQEPKP